MSLRGMMIVWCVFMVVAILYLVGCALNIGSGEAKTRLTSKRSVGEVEILGSEDEEDK